MTLNTVYFQQKWIKQRMVWFTKVNCLLEYIED